MIPLFVDIARAAKYLFLVSLILQSVETMSKVRCLAELKEIIAKHSIKKVYLFLGNGPRMQYKDINAVNSQVSDALSPETRDNNRWLAVFGGDTYVESKPDLGSVIHYLKEKHNPILLSVQGWDENDPHIEYIWRYSEQKDSETGKVLYGGFKDGAPVGGTEVYLGDEFIQLLTGVVNIDARGWVGSKEVAYARAKGVKVIDVSPAVPRYNG